MLSAPTMPMINPKRKSQRTMNCEFFASTPKAAVLATLLLVLSMTVPAAASFSDSIRAASAKIRQWSLQESLTKAVNEVKEGASILKGFVGSQPMRSRREIQDAFELREVSSNVSDNIPSEGLKAHDTESTYAVNVPTDSLCINEPIQLQWVAPVDHNTRDFIAIYHAAEKNFFAEKILGKGSARTSRGSLVFERPDEDTGNPRLPEVPGEYVFKYISMPDQEVRAESHAVPFVRCQAERIPGQYPAGMGPGQMLAGGVGDAFGQQNASERAHEGGTNAGSNGTEQFEVNTVELPSGSPPAANSQSEPVSPVEAVAAEEAQSNRNEAKVGDAPHEMGPTDKSDVPSTQLLQEPLQDPLVSVGNLGAGGQNSPEVLKTEEQDTLDQSGMSNSTSNQGLPLQDARGDRKESEPQRIDGLIPGQEQLSTPSGTPSLISGEEQSNGGKGEGNSNGEVPSITESEAGDKSKQGHADEAGANLPNPILPSDKNTDIDTVRPNDANPVNLGANVPDNGGVSEETGDGAEAEGPRTQNPPLNDDQTKSQAFAPASGGDAAISNNAGSPTNSDQENTGASANPKDESSTDENLKGTAASGPPENEGTSEKIAGSVQNGEQGESAAGTHQSGEEPGHGDAKAGASNFEGSQSGNSNAVQADQSDPLDKVQQKGDGDNRDDSAGAGIGRSDDLQPIEANVQSSGSPGTLQNGENPSQVGVEEGPNNLKDGGETSGEMVDQSKLPDDAKPKADRDSSNPGNAAGGKGTADNLDAIPANIQGEPQGETSESAGSSQGREESAQEGVGQSQSILEGGQSNVEGGQSNPEGGPEGGQSNHEGGQSDLDGGQSGKASGSGEQVDQPEQPLPGNSQNDKTKDPGQSVDSDIAEQQPSPGNSQSDKTESVDSDIGEQQPSSSKSQSDNTEGPLAGQSVDSETGEQQPSSSKSQSDSIGGSLPEQSDDSETPAGGGGAENGPKQGRPGSGGSSTDQDDDAMDSLIDEAEKEEEEEDEDEDEDEEGAEGTQNELNDDDFQESDTDGALPSHRIRFPGNVKGDGTADRGGGDVPDGPVRRPSGGGSAGKGREDGDDGWGAGGEAVDLDDDSDAASVNDWQDVGESTPGGKTQRLDKRPSAAGTPASGRVKDSDGGRGSVAGKGGWDAGGEEDGEVTAEPEGAGTGVMGMVLPSGALIGGLVGLSVLAASAVLLIVRRWRAGGALRKGGTHGDYVAVEMQADPAAGAGTGGSSKARAAGAVATAADDDFGGFAVISGGGAADSGAGRGGSSGADGWGNDAWDEFDELDSLRPPTLTAYDKDGVKALLDVDAGGGDGEVNVSATFKSSLAEPLDNFTCKFAVPTHLELRLGPPSGTTLGAGAGAVTQSLTLTRKSGAARKPIKLRLLIEYRRGGRAVHDTVDVTSFPADL